MTDIFTKEQRSRCMSKIRSKNTGPELIVRRLVFSLGYRYRLHRRDLPGSPDLVFASRKKVIFVHGCFWHRHRDCKKGSVPRTRPEFWQVKLNGNMERDARNVAALETAGWKVLVVWECEVNTASIAEKIKRFLSF